MNILFIHHDPEIQTEINDFIQNRRDNCFFSKNTDDTIRILEEHHIDLVVLIINHMRDAAVLKYINDNYKALEVLLMASEEYDEIISLFSECQYKMVRLPLKLADLKTKIDKLLVGRVKEDKRNSMSNETNP